MSVFDSMIVHIQDAKSPKQAWDTLVKMYNTNTQACKMQFKQKLHNLQKNKMNINDYHRGQQPNSNSNYYYCGKPRHMAKNCYQKRSMMHEMENYNKGIMHQLTIKVMNNYL